MNETKTEKAAVSSSNTRGGAPHVVIVPWSDELALVAFKQYNANFVDKIQRQAFPSGENLLALIFVSLADLSHRIRETRSQVS